MSDRAELDRARAWLVSARAWLVTGPLGRGLAFAIDFAAALRTLLVQRRARTRTGGRRGART